MPEPTAAPDAVREASPSPEGAAQQPVAPAGWFRLARNLFVGVVCALILGLGVGSFQGLSSLKEAPPRSEREADVFQVEVYEAESADVRRTISAFGTARADRVVVVSAEISGRIVEADRLKVGRPVIGQHVEITADGRSERVTGDVLVHIDPEVYRHRLDRVEEQVEQNQRLLELQTERRDRITQDYENKEQLAAQGGFSTSELLRLELEVKQFQDAVMRLERDVALFESDLELATIDFQNTEVRPPFSGIISQVMVEEGQYVQIGEPLFEITDNDLVEIPVAVSLADSVEIAAELSDGRYPEVALAQSETAPAKWFGSVLRISPVADEETRTVDVFIEVRNDEQDVPLRPGTFLHARIAGVVLRNAVLIPRDAIIDGSVFIVAEGDSEPEAADGSRQRAQRQEIIVERTVQSLAMVQDGISPGDQIVLTNLDVIDEGELLRAGVARNLDDELNRHLPAYAHRVDEEEGAAGSGL